MEDGSGIYIDTFIYIKRAHGSELKNRSYSNLSYVFDLHSVTIHDKHILSLLTYQYRIIISSRLHTTLSCLVCILLSFRRAERPPLGDTCGGRTGLPQV